MKVLTKAKELYSNVTLKTYKAFSDAVAFGDVYGSKALKTLGLTTLVTLPVFAQTQEPEIPYKKQLTVKSLTRIPFFNMNKNLDKIRIYMDVGDVVDNNGDGVNDIISFDVGSWNQYEALKQLLQQCKDIVLEKVEPKLVSVNPMKPGGTAKVDYGVTLDKVKVNGAETYQITVNNPDKTLRFTGTGSFEVDDVEKPEFKNGSITPQKIVPPVTRRSQYKYYHKGQRGKKTGK